jgi:hypothetical protein
MAKAPLTLDFRILITRMTVQSPDWCRFPFVSPEVYLQKENFLSASSAHDALMIRESGLSVTEIAEKLVYPTIHCFSNQLTILHHESYTI